jgi:carboxyl-terminal processing protease
MLIAANKGAGQNIGGPDVCLTPPAPTPVPYINIAYNAMSVAFCPTILLSMLPAHNKGTFIPITFGDVPGTASPNMRKGEYVHGNLKVFLMGLQGINLTNPTTGNAKNDSIGIVAVPSATNVFFTYAHAAGGEHGAMTLEALAELGQSLSTSRRGDGPAVDGVLLARGVGHVVVRRFSGDVPSAVYHAVRQLTAQGMTSLLLDLRGNPGGEMNAFVQLAGDFLAPGSVVVTMTDTDGDDTVYRARQPAPYLFPVTLLVDAGTASAAELFAGCLQAHGRAVVAGERTFGKGEAQAVVVSAAGDAVYGTVARFTLPDGRTVQGAGIEPDVPWSGGELTGAAGTSPGGPAAHPGGAAASPGPAAAPPGTRA